MLRFFFAVFLVVGLATPSLAGRLDPVNGDYWEVMQRHSDSLEDYVPVLDELIEAYGEAVPKTEVEKVPSFQKERGSSLLFYHSPEKKVSSFRVIGKPYPPAFMAKVKKVFPKIKESDLADYSQGMVIKGYISKRRGPRLVVKMLRKLEKQDESDQLINNLKFGPEFTLAMPKGSKVVYEQKAEGGKLIILNVQIPGTVEDIKKHAMDQFNASKLRFRDTDSEAGFSIRFEDNTRTGNYASGTYIVTKSELDGGFRSGVISINIE